MNSATKLAMLEAFANVPSDNPVVKWSTVPQVLHKWLERYLLSAGRPEGGIWKWDYIRARDHFEAELHEILSVADEPDVSMTEWRFMPWSDQMRLSGLVGRHRRITSIVSAFDLQEMLVTTASGRRYWLRGAPMRANYNGQK